MSTKHDQREARLVADTVRKASQSKKQREVRLAADTVSISTFRGRECEESHRRRILVNSSVIGDWIDKENLVFAYDETIHYNEDIHFSISEE